MSRTPVLNRSHDAETLAVHRDGLPLVDLRADARTEEHVLADGADGAEEVEAADDEELDPPVRALAPLGLGMPVVRTPMTAEELQQVSWQERALCSQTDPEAFFPEKGGSTREAKRVCLGCDVRPECLEYALTHDERFGIWGGLSERERRRVKREAV